MGADASRPERVGEAGEGIQLLVQPSHALGLAYFLLEP
jgi:hypothetical protein